MKNILHRTWRIIRIPLGVLLILYIGLVVYRIPAAFEREKTKETVARIHAQKLTLADVTGERLPPVPDPSEVDATIEGIDANSNGIRDDVELAIFKLYPNSARIRAAELQYAKALQFYFIDVFNSETLVAAIQEEERGDFCIAETTPKVDLSDTEENIRQAFALADEYSKEVEDLMFNIPERRQKYQEIFKYMTSYGSIGGENCDIDLPSLLN